MTDDEMFARRRLALEISVQAGWKPTPAEVQEWLWPTPVFVAKASGGMSYNDRRNILNEMISGQCSTQEIVEATGLLADTVYKARSRYRKDLGILPNTKHQESGRASQVVQAAKRAAAAAH